MDERLMLSLNRLAWTLGIRRITLEELATAAASHYHPFLLKRPGKKPRQIDNPDPQLKSVQGTINRMLLKDFPFPEYVHGGIKGRSPYTNAREHLNKRSVVRLDVRDFFPSITDQQVYSVWIQKLGCSRPVASLLTALTTYHRHLPQGAPTSSSLANLMLLDADMEIYQAASQAGCSYTRYVDDLILSGDHPQALIEGALQALQKTGFRISRKKLLIMRADCPQEVTGLSVNSRKGPSVPRHRRDQIRAAINQLKSIPRGAEFNRLTNSVRGRIGHLSRINPGAANSLTRYLESVIDSGDTQSLDSIA
jgi:RNA-directed DNA polymerase